MLVSSREYRRRSFRRRFKSETDVDFALLILQRQKADDSEVQVTVYESKHRS